MEYSWLTVLPSLWPLDISVDSEVYGFSPLLYADRGMVEASYQAGRCFGLLLR